MTIVTENRQHELRFPQGYSFKMFGFMKPQGPHMPLTEAYVSIPPALWIRDEEGALWTLGFDYDEKAWRGGKYEYDVIRNGRKTGEFARIIEFTVRQGGTRKVRVWGAEGWRTYSNGRFA